MNPSLPPSKPSRQQVNLVALGLVGLVVVIYAQTARFPFINLDDPGYVYDNPHVKAGLTWSGWRWAWGTFERSNWHPLTWLSLMADAQIYGLRAGGYHVTNFVLHGASVLLLFRWLFRTTRVLWPAAMTAALFAAHPMHVESVAWVTERKDVLSTVFFCLTLLAYSRYARGGYRRMRYFCLALVSYALGLMAKPMLVTLPPLLLLLDYWPLRRFTPATLRDTWLRLIVEKVPFGVLMMASCGITYLAQRTHAVVSFESLPAGFRLASAALGVGTYLEKTFYPAHLGVYYPYWYGVPIWVPVAWGLVLALITAGAISRWRQEPFLTVGWLWFLGTLVPVIGVVQVSDQAIADRYTYVPHIGLFIALCYAGQGLRERWPGLRRILGLLAGIIVVVCLWLSVRQVGYWRGSATLFSHTLGVVPQPSARLYTLAADADFQAGKTGEAAMLYERAYRLGGPGPNDSVAERLAVLWFQAGRWRDVVNLLEPLSRESAVNGDLLHTLGSAYLRGGETEQARAAFARCNQLHPELASGYFGLGECGRLTGDVPGACAEYEAGLARDGDDPPALSFLAWVYAHLDVPEAQARALVLARRAATLTHGQDLASLHALAAAEAANGHWPEGIAAARSALNLAARPSTAPEAAELARTRLEAYERGELP